MAVLIRESREIDGKVYKDLKVYRSENLLITTQDEAEALKLDKYIADLFSDLARETKANQLIELKNKPGVIELWYYIGQRLKFVDNAKVVHPNDRKYIWQALWQHAGDLVPGEMKSRASTSRDHFLYCYRLASFEKEFVMSAGNWRAWQDFFDSPILSNRIILAWFEKNISELNRIRTKNWLRNFIKIVRNEFQNIDLSWRSEKEINDKLDGALCDLIEKHPLC
jgi:hypothetical protein